MSKPAAAIDSTTGRTYTLSLPPEWLGQHPPAAHVRMSGTTAMLPSVTSVLSLHAKHGLTWWAAGEVASYVMSEPDEANAIVGSALTARDITGDRPCKACGQPTDRLLADKGWFLHSACEKPWKELRKVFNTQRQKKADLGSLVHDLVERHVLGESIDPADYGEAEGHVKSWLRFVERHDPGFVMAEATVFNLRHGYAGTLDLIMDVGGARYLTDCKTSPRTYFENHLQLAAYRYAEGIYIDAGQVEPMPTVDDTAILLLGEDRYKFIQQPEGYDDATGRSLAIRDGFERGYLPLLTLFRYKEAQGE